MAEAAFCGKFVWHELLTSDLKAAATFYGKIVGWGSQVCDTDPSYTFLTMGGRPVAGMMVLPEAAKAMGAPPHWESYISTPNVDATAIQAGQLGGTVLKPPADIPDYGRYAILQDPQGAVFAAFTPKRAARGDARQADARPGVGEFFWHELATTNGEAAFSFYQKLFGWDKADAVDMGPQGVYQMFGGNGKTFGGMYNKPSAMPGPAFWLPYPIVPDAKAAAETIKELGGKILNGPMEVPGGDWVVVGMDLQGAAFALHSRKAAVRAPAAKSQKAVKKTKPARKAAPAKKTKPVKRTKKAKPAKKKARQKTKKGGKKR